MGLVDLGKLSPASFPATEDDSFEFKSSLMNSNEINKELNHAASAFANSGGGCFIWGVADENGDADGGVEPLVGKQDVTAWIDKVIHNVSPPPGYSIRTFNDREGRGTLDAGKIIVAVSIHPSNAGPHMAHDSRYYIRAGRHTVPANHTLVEALWAKREVQTPILEVMLKKRPDTPISVVDLWIVNLTNSPAISVELDVDPKFDELNMQRNFFPIRLTLVDRANPFGMFLAFSSSMKKVFNHNVEVSLKYNDLAGTEYRLKRTSVELVAGLEPSMREAIERF